MNKIIITAAVLFGIFSSQSIFAQDLSIEAIIKQNTLGMDLRTEYFQKKNWRQEGIPDPNQIQKFVFYNDQKEKTSVIIFYNVTENQTLINGARFYIIDPQYSVQVQAELEKMEPFSHPFFDRAPAPVKFYQSGNNIIGLFVRTGKEAQSMMGVDHFTEIHFMSANSIDEILNYVVREEEEE